MVSQGDNLKKGLQTCSTYYFYVELWEKNYKESWNKREGAQGTQKWVQAWSMTRTLCWLAWGGTRTGSISAFPTVSVFLIYKRGKGCAPKSPWKLLNFMIPLAQHMLFFCAIFKRRHNLVKLHAHLYMLRTITSMLNVQYIYFFT